jgi:uncharacterized protein involved in exopolysaccharide biosynthesis
VNISLHFPLNVRAASLHQHWLYIKSIAIFDLLLSFVYYFFPPPDSGTMPRINIGQPSAEVRRSHPREFALLKQLGAELDKEVSRKRQNLSRHHQAVIRMDLLRVCWQHSSVRSRHYERAD